MTHIIRNHDTRTCLDRSGKSPYIIVDATNSCLAVYLLRCGPGWSTGCEVAFSEAPLGGSPSVPCLDLIRYKCTMPRCMGCLPPWASLYNQFWQCPFLQWPYQLDF